MNFIEKQYGLFANILLLSSKDLDIYRQLIQLMMSVKVGMIQYALVKLEETKNLKAQIRTYEIEVDLLRQENYELTMKRNTDTFMDSQEEDESDSDDS